MPNLSKEEWKEALKDGAKMESYGKKGLWQRFIPGHGVLLACNVGMLFCGLGLLPSEYALAGIMAIVWTISDMRTHFSPY
jgi:hypothetical protein